MRSPGLLDRASLSAGRLQYEALIRLSERLAGFRREATTLEGVHVPYLVGGSGPVLMLVHGFGADKESWLLMARHLAKKRMVVVPDLPGYGAAGTIPKERASAKRQAAIVAALLDHLGRRYVHLVGNSMGGGISLRFAADYPDRAKTMTLVCSVGPVVDKSEVFLAIDRGESPLVLRDETRMDEFMALVAEKWPPSTTSIRRYRAHVQVARADHLDAMFEGWHRPSPAEDYPKDLGALRVPALVIHGAKDRVIDVSTGRALAAGLSPSKLEVLEGIGHLPQMEAPRRTARLVDAFVDAYDKGP
ncbi:MAG: alpha/beta fold hydrolase [Polyangiaceae bacterium]